MLISNFGWGTSGGVQYGHTSSGLRGKFCISRIHLRFHTGVSKEAIACYWFGGYIVWWTMVAWTKMIFKGLVFPYLVTLPMATWWNWFQMLALVFCNFFIFYIRQGFGCLPILLVQWPRAAIHFAVPTLSWLQDVFILDWPGFIWNHRCIISFTSILNWRILPILFLTLHVKVVKPMKIILAKLLGWHDAFTLCPHVLELLNGCWSNATLSTKTFEEKEEKNLSPSCWSGPGGETGRHVWAGDGTPVSLWDSEVVISLYCLI